MEGLGQPRLPQQEVPFSRALVVKLRPFRMKTERYSIYRRTGLEAELRARAVADESLSKTVGVLKEDKYET